MCDLQEEGRREDAQCAPSALLWTTAKKKDATRTHAMMVYVATAYVAMMCATMASPWTEGQNDRVGRGGDGGGAAAAASLAPQLLQRGAEIEFVDFSIFQVQPKNHSVTL